MSAVTLYRYLVNAGMPNHRYVGPNPPFRNDLLAGMVPVDEFFSDYEPPLTQVMIRAAIKRATRQAEAMRRVDREFEIYQELQNEQIRIH